MRPWRRIGTNGSGGADPRRRTWGCHSKDEVALSAWQNSMRSSRHLFVKYRKCRTVYYRMTVEVARDVNHKGAVPRLRNGIQSARGKFDLQVFPGTTHHKRRHGSNVGSRRSEPYGLLRLRLPNRTTSRLGTVVARCPQASAKEPQHR